MTNNGGRVAARQILCLEQMAEHSKREAVAFGLTKIAENINSLLTEAKHIDNMAPRASTILTQIAAEEAGKGFLIVDYMRPYRSVSPEQRSHHLRSVYSHLARGIYVEYYLTRPDAFSEVESIINFYRASHYLDGPSDVDWIFRNEIEEKRERQLYVDLMSDEQGLSWYAPTDLWKRLAKVGSVHSFEPTICKLFLLMHQSGFFQEKALNVMAEIWKNVIIHSTTRWAQYMSVNHNFLRQCGMQGILSQTANNEALARVADEFLYPLCGLDLGRRNVPIDQLQQRRIRHLRFLEGEP
jgi:hypothetical protein